MATICCLFVSTICCSDRDAEVWPKNSCSWEHRVGFWKRQWKVLPFAFHAYSIVLKDLKQSRNFTFVGRLYGSRVAASDLRGGVSLVLAGLAAQGTTEVNGMAHIDRGYENFEMKLRLLGADVKRLTIPP